MEVVGQFSLYKKSLKQCLHYPTSSEYKRACGALILRLEWCLLFKNDFFSMIELLMII